MSFQERKSIVSLISSILIIIIYSAYVYFTDISGKINLADDLYFWAKIILIFFPVMIVAKILIHIAFYIVSHFTSDEKLPDFEDELDKLIEMKAARNSHYFFMLSFIFSISTIVMGFTPMAMFLCFALTISGACIINDISQIYLYKRGF